MKSNLVIIGAGGLGREVAWLASEARDPWSVGGFLDDRRDIAEAELGRMPHLGAVDQWRDLKNSAFVVAIGNPRVRANVVARMRDQGSPVFVSLVHQSCSIGPFCSIADGAIIGAGCVLTTNIKVGEHAIINIGTTVGHDVTVGPCATVAPGVTISGCVTIMDGVEVGTGASIRQGLKLETGAMLGMGSVLTKNIPPNCMFFGVPAKFIKNLPPFGASEDRAPRKDPEHA